MKILVMSNATNKHAQEILALVVNAHQHSLSRAFLDCRHEVLKLLTSQKNKHFPHQSQLCCLLFHLTVTTATLIFISECGSAISSAKEGKSGFIYNFVKS